MDYTLKLIKRIPIKSVLIHLLGLIVSMSIIWGVSYLMLVTFLIQDSTALIPSEPIMQIKTPHIAVKKVATSTATSSKTKIKK